LGNPTDPHHDSTEADCRFSTQCELDNCDANRNGIGCFSRGISLANQLLPCTAQVNKRDEELAVPNKAMSCVENNELFGTSTKRGSECSRDAPTLLESAEVYGGGNEYSPFWRLPLWPFSWIRFLTQEEE
jgi:hypothetical protein